MKAYVVELQEENIVLKARLAESDDRAARLAVWFDESQARLAEAETALQRMMEAADDSDGCQYGTLSTEFVRQQCRHGLRLADSASAVQPERCCLDYPRCDCNSPPEPDNAPTLQPCGHPWKAQHDFKCILCSSPG